MIAPAFHSELPLEHFSLQYEYAKRAANVSHISIEQALLEFTQYWRRVHDITVLRTLNSEWSFDRKTPEWQALCCSINANERPDIVAYDLYIKNNNSSEKGKEYFGCFGMILIKKPMLE